MREGREGGFYSRAWVFQLGRGEREEEEKGGGKRGEWKGGMKL